MGYHDDPSDERRAVITDNLGNKIDASVAVHRLVVARDLRFPDHNTPGDRLGRLLAEIGDLAAAVLTIEQGTPFAAEGVDPRAALTEALYHVVRATGGIAHHHQLPVRLPDTTGYLRADNPHVLLDLLTQAGGALARAVDHAIRTGEHTDDARPVSDELGRAVRLVIVRVLVLAEHYEVSDDLRAVIENCYRNHQTDGFLR